MSIYQLSQLMGIKPQTLYGWLKWDVTARPHTSTLLSCCYVLGLDIDWRRNELSEDLAEKLPRAIGKGTLRDGVLWLES